LVKAGMLEAYLTSASSLDVKLKILIQTVMAEKRLIQQNKFDRTMQIEHQQQPVVSISVEHFKTISYLAHSLDIPRLIRYLS
jgi:hypothetical protein